MISRSQMPSHLVNIRMVLQDLLSHSIQTNVILRRAVKDILRVVDAEIAPEICNVAAKFDHSIVNGTKPIFHLEEFVARLMQINATFLQSQRQPNILGQLEFAL